jgi:predicted nucleic acid-binding protein
MNKNVIVDTGVLVALQNRNDQYHTWTAQQLAGIAPPLLSCEAVISETCFLLREFPKREVLFQWIDKGVIQIAFRLSDHNKAIRESMAKYVDVPMSYADACLVRMAEIHKGSRILTLETVWKFQP